MAVSDHEVREVRAVARRPVRERWSREALEQLRALPWAWQAAPPHGGGGPPAVIPHVPSAGGSSPPPPRATAAGRARTRGAAAVLLCLQTRQPHVRGRRVGRGHHGHQLRRAGRRLRVSPRRPRFRRLRGRRQAWTVDPHGHARGRCHQGSQAAEPLDPRRCIGSQIPDARSQM